MLKKGVKIFFPTRDKISKYAGEMKVFLHFWGWEKLDKIETEVEEDTERTGGEGGENASRKGRKVRKGEEGGSAFRLKVESLAGRWRRGEREPLASKDVAAGWKARAPGTESSGKPNVDWPTGGFRDDIGWCDVMQGR